MRIVLLIFTLLVSLTMNAQRGMVKGGVIDPINEKGVNNARVWLLRPNGVLVDSTRADIPREKTTEVDGMATFISYQLNTKNPATFSFRNVEPGHYLIKVEKEGYDTLVQPIEAKFSGRDKSFDCGDLWVYETAKQLSEASVTGTRLLLVHKGDTTIYNAAALQTSEGDMLGNLIEKLPGASINSSGQIYVNGRYVENLLINGKDFFNGDVKAAMSSLPAYTVNKIKTYEREGERSLTTGVDMGDKQFVMDVSLKRQYEKTWTGDFEARGGTKDRYLLYANIMRIDQHQMFAIRGEANNMNTSKSNFGTYVFNRTSDVGIHTYRSAYLMYQYEPNRSIRFGANGQATNKLDRSETGKSSETYLSNGNTFGRSNQQERSVSTSVTTTTNLSYRPAKGWYVSSGYSFMFNKNHSHSYSRSASYLLNPDDLFSANALDSTFALSSGDFLLHKYVQTRLSQESLNRGHSTSHNANIELQKSFGMDLLAVRGKISHRNSATKTYNLYDLQYPHVSESANDFRHRFYDKTMDSTDGSAGADYTYKFIQNDSVDGQLITEYSFSHYHDQSNNPLYRLDKMDNYSADQGIDMLPSTRNALLATLDVPNSFNRRQTLISHSATLNLNQKLRLRNHTWLTLKAQLPFEYAINKLDYERNLKLHRVDKTGKFLNPSVELGWNPKKDDKDGTLARIEFKFESVGRLPSPNFMLDITDESDPLSSWTGNPNMKNPRENSYHLSYSTWNRQTNRNLILSASYQQLKNEIATQRIYNKETGAVQTTSVNVDGNWNLNLHEYYSMYFGKGQKCFFNLQTNFNLIHNRDLNYWDAEAANQGEISNVRTIQVAPVLNLRYNPNSKMSCSLNLNSKWQHMDSNRKDYTTTNAWTFNYSLNFATELPLDFELSTDLGVISRLGYSDASLNESRWLWNMKLTRKFKYNLSMNVQAYDILHQNKSIASVVNAQGRTETYSLVLPAYISLGVTWKFSRAQGAKNKKEISAPALDASSIKEIKL